MLILQMQTLPMVVVQVVVLVQREREQLIQLAALAVTELLIHIPDHQ
jgi:hypothetical protein